ncbi:MAG: YSIRK-type signal peptide-containing protein, partial [Limosilactobacillus sp.]|uniref:YSIRK-type signal peptide-containing protein n=1 Tax=Limosilactobacillus sp. TaxID=2773925 RepID=UPI00270A4F4E|nr:YSIRK-type signal peptide-containing protein [Limosilactobacillus sp.]
MVINKNNKTYNSEKQKQHFGLRKLSVGVASVLLSTTFIFGVNATVSADTVVDQSSNPSSLMTASLYGLDSHISTFSYLGHTTTTNSDGQIQDVYQFVDSNEYVNVQRVLKIYNIQGLDTSKINITYQASDASGNPTSGSSVVQTQWWGNTNAIPETHSIQSKIDESQTGYSRNVLITITMTRSNNSNPALFTGIVGVSNRSSLGGFDLSNAAVNASAKAKTTYSPDTATDIKQSSTANITIAQQSYKMGDNPTTISTDQASGTGSDKIKSITYSSAPDTSAETSTAKTAKATVTFNDGSTTTVDVPYIVTSIASTDGKDATINSQSYSKNGNVADLTSSDVTGVDSSTVSKVEWETEPNTNQDAGTYSDATAKITFTDGSTKEVTVNYTITESDADKVTPNVPAKTEVSDTTNLTDDEKSDVAQKVEDANKDNFPEGTTVTVGNDGTATITYPDGTTDTIPGTDLVSQKSDADKVTPNVPAKTEVSDTTNLTDDEKSEVAQKVEDANKDNFPEGTTVTVGNDGTA